jgi:hypothetical protein
MKYRQKQKYNESMKEPAVSSQRQTRLRNL